MSQLSVAVDWGCLLTGHSLRSAWSTGLDLTRIVSYSVEKRRADLPGLKTDGEVGNVDRLGLTRSVRGHDTPAVGLRELDAASLAD
jgi:hypothetical protein